MGGLLTYSGIATKVRAMEGHLISGRQFGEMCQLERVGDAADYLKRLPAYRDLFINVEDSLLHRAYIEQQLTISLYRDFSRLYRFSNPAQRKFLSLYFMHFEIAIIKRCLRNILGNQRKDINLSVFRDFFNHHSKLDLEKLESAADVPEFITGLEGSPYFALFERLWETGHPTIFDYEMHMDLLYFQNVYKLTKKHLSKAERDIIGKCFGAKLDMLNIQWIFRSKKYYHLSSVDIYTLLIPHHHRLSEAQIKTMVEAQNLEEFYAALQHTYYGSLKIESEGPPNLEGLYQAILDKIHADTNRKNPYSIAALNSYLYFKEQEIRKLIMLIESIRYQIDGNEIYSHLQAQ